METNLSEITSQPREPGTCFLLGFQRVQPKGDVRQISKALALSHSQERQKAPPTSSSNSLSSTASHPAPAQKLRQGSFPGSSQVPGSPQASHLRRAPPLPEAQRALIGCLIGPAHCLSPTLFSSLTPVNHTGHCFDRISGRLLV